MKMPEKIEAIGRKEEGNVLIKQRKYLKASKKYESV